MNKSALSIDNNTFTKLNSDESFSSISYSFCQSIPYLLFGFIDGLAHSFPLTQLTGKIVNGIMPLGIPENYALMGLALVTTVLIANADRLYYTEKNIYYRSSHERQRAQDSHVVRSIIAASWLKTLPQAAMLGYIAFSVILPYQPVAARPAGLGVIPLGMAICQHAERPIYDIPVADYKTWLEDCFKRWRGRDIMALGHAIATCLFTAYYSALTATLAQDAPTQLNAYIGLAIMSIPLLFLTAQTKVAFSERMSTHHNSTFTTSTATVKRRRPEQSCYKTNCPAFAKKIISKLCLKPWRDHRHGMFIAMLKTALKLTTIPLGMRLVCKEPRALYQFYAYAIALLTVGIASYRGSLSLHGKPDSESSLFLVTTTMTNQRTQTEAGTSRRAYGSEASSGVYTQL